MWARGPFHPTKKKLPRKQIVLRTHIAAKLMGFSLFLMLCSLLQQYY